MKIEFKKEFAGKPKGFVGEYSKNNAQYLINSGIGVEFKEKPKKDANSK